jgi:Lectin C-type domain
MNRTLTSRALGQGHGLGLGCAFTDRAWRRHVSGVGALGGAILAAALLSLSACGGASGPGSDLGKVTSEIVTGVTPVLTISPGATNFTAQGAAIVVDPNLTLTISDGSDLPGVQVSISTGYVTGQDVLGFTPQAGVTGVWTAATGVLALTGTASVASYQTVLRSVTYNNTAANPNTQARVVTFSIGAGSLSFGGHYYEFVPTGLTWTAAKAAAAARTYYGLAGYLATITTAGENAFISAKLTATGWIGASDAANEGQWRWVTGPENGTLFYIENTLQSCPPAPDTCTQGTHTYASWNSGEPNNSGGENYAQFYAGGLGTWNDLNGTQALGYVVEYGGTAGDPTPQVSGPKAVTVSSLPNYSITASAGANGTISPIGVNSYQQGQSQIFTITPSTNYGVASVLVDGVSVGVVTTYTFSNVIANHTISATFSPPTIAVSAGNNQSANVAAAFGTPLSVLVSNSGGTPISGATVLFAAPGSGASATVTASATTNASGIASTTATANATAGGYNVTATIGGTTVATTFALRNLGAPSSIAVVSGGSQSAVVQGAFAAPLVAVVRDSTSFALPNVTVTFAAPSSAGASAALGATSVTTNASGQASVTATANTVAGTYAVAASAPGVGSAASFALANLAGVAAHIALTGGATQTTVVGAPFGAPIVASVTDTFGNPVSGATVTFAAPGSGASAALATPMPSTSAQGLAQTTVIANTVAGNYSVSASIAAGASATTMLANTAGAPALVMLTSGSGQIALAGAAFASPLGVAVVDTYGNTVSGATVAFTAIAAAGTGASATLTSGSAVTNAPGLASVLATANGSAGSYVVTAIAGGAPAASFALTNQFLLALSPTGASVAPRGSVTFAPTGGSGVGYVFAFQSAPSGGTIDPATGVYTAGATPLVTDVITVTDSQSHTATASISVGAALALAPLPTRVPPRGGAVFTATGGSQSGLVFTIVNNNSNGTIDSSGSYVAGQNDSVTDLVSVVDSLGNSATASIDVGPTVSLAASATSTPPRGSLSFAASGGSGTFTYALGQNQSGGRIDPATGAYTAGSVFDQTDEVTATDGLGNSASVNIAVGHGITVSPASPSVPPLGTFTLSASGGSGTGFAFTLGGGASGAISDPASGVYVAGAAPNASDLVTVTDSLGNTATTSISVGGGIRVSPSSLTTPPLGSQAFSVSGGSGAGYVFSLSSHPSGGTIDASTGGYTAGATGSTVDGLSVVDSLGNHATVVITVGPGLGLSPATATLAPLGHQAINVSGGSGSGYTFALSSNSSGGLVDALTGAYTAGAIGGVVDVVTAHDDLGNLATATLTLTPALTVAPSTLSAAPRASLSITASGGAPAYAFSLSSNGSGGTIDPATGAYTAGSNPDSADVITIMDHNGATTNLVVTVGPGVGILPAHPSVAPRGPIAFGGVNGSGTGYRFALADNQSGGTIVAATGAYTAGPTGDVADLVSVTDSLGNTTTVSVAVGGRLVLGPASASVAPRESLAVYAVAGSGTGYVYAFRTNASGGSIDATTGAYVAGVAPDVTDVILVTDSLGNTATTSIGVGPGLTVMPASASTAPRGTVSLTSAGGSATGYGFSLSTNGSSGSVSASGIYTAGATGDTVDVVTVTDSLGNTDTVTIMVGHALTVTATAGTVPPRGTTTFTAVGGVGGGYVFTVRTNGSGGNIVGSTGVYTAGDTASSTDIIEVTDPFGNRATLAVTVGPGITITPAALSAPPHGKLTLMATGGSGIGYHFALTSNASGGTLDATSGLYTAGSTTDVLDAVQVTDTLGNTANATIAVGGALTVNPSAPTVAPRDSMTFTAAGGNGSGFTFALATNASGGTIDATSGRYTAGALGNVQDIVTVSDPLGNLAHATIDVGDGLHVTPSTVQAAPLAKMTFTVSGGSGKGYSFALTTNTSQGTIDPGTGAYTAGAQGGGTDVVTVADSLGNTATASIHLGAALSTSTPTVTVAPNGTTIITVTGGGTMLTYTLTTNGSGGSINPVTGAYTAGPKGGTTDVITVSDGNHATVTITVQIGPSLSTKPLTGTVQTGQTITLSTAGGSGSGQHWTIVSAGSGGTVNATTGAYTAGPHAGVDVVQVVDSLGNSAQVSIPVTAAGATTVGSSGGGGCSCTLGTAGAVGLRTTALALGACGLVLLGRRRRRR